MPVAFDPVAYEDFVPGQYVKLKQPVEDNAGIVCFTDARERAWGLVRWTVTTTCMEPYEMISHMSELTVTDLATVNRTGYYSPIRVMAPNYEIESDFESDFETNSEAMFEGKEN